MGKQSMLKMVSFLNREKLYIMLLLFVVAVNSLVSIAQELSVPEDLGAPADGATGRLLENSTVREALENNSVAYLIFLYIVFLTIFSAIAGIILDIVYLFLKKSGRYNLLRTAEPGEASWGILDICKVIIIFLAAQHAIFLMDALVTSTIPYLEGVKSIRLVFGSFIADIAGVAAVFNFVIRRGGQSITSIGLSRDNFLINVRYGTLAYLGLVPILAAVMFTAAFLFKRFNIPVEPQPILYIIRDEKNIVSLVVIGLFTSLLGPVMEEVFFRGFAYGYLRKKLGVSWGIILSAAFFAFVHGNLASFFPILSLGLVLAYVYEKTGSLVASSAVHIIHNSISLFFLIFYKTITS